MFGGDAFYLGHLGKVPVYVRPDILLLLVLVYMWSPPGIPFFIVLFMVFVVSILLHELGHALVATARGMDGVAITLTGLGGYCSYRGIPDPGRKLLISLAGPFVNFALAGAAWLVLHYVSIPADLLRFAVKAMLVVNLILGIFNILPIYPLDGGQSLLALLRLRLVTATANGIVLATSVVVLAAVILWRFRVEGRLDTFLVVIGAFCLMQAFRDLR